MPFPLWCIGGIDRLGGMAITYLNVALGIGPNHMLYSDWCSAAAPHRPVSMAVIRTFDFSSAMYLGLDAIANRKIYETYMHSGQIAGTGT